MVESTWTGVCLLLQVWLSGFVGKCNLGKRISLEAQVLFGIRRNPAVADKQCFNQKSLPFLLLGILQDTQAFPVFSNANILPFR